MPSLVDIDVEIIVQERLFSFAK